MIRGLTAVAAALVLLAGCSGDDDEGFVQELDESNEQIIIDNFGSLEAWCAAVDITGGIDRTAGEAGNAAAQASIYRIYDANCL